MYHKRYEAIRNPIAHRQSLNSARYIRNSFTKYVLVVVVCAILVNVPKFFEAEISWQCNQTDATESHDSNKSSHERITR